MRGTIGDRVTEALAGRRQKDVAEAIGMTPDAFSRALSGQRNFSAVELVSVAELLEQDVHFLVTGEQDPHRMVLSARHTWDPMTRDRDVPGAQDDQAVMAQVSHVYRQVADLTQSTGVLPTDAAAARAALGAGFVPELRVRFQVLDVDVVCVPGLTTAYSFWAAGRAVVVVPATGNWFFQNFGAAHELAHLALGHRGILPGHGALDKAEAEANAFAADLLMPADVLASFDWPSMSPPEVAEVVWELGVSTKALSNRLSWFGHRVDPVVDEALRLSTQGLLRKHWARGRLASVLDRDPITERMAGAARRSFPQWLVEAHLRCASEGQVTKSSLAWMLDVDSALLDIGLAEPDPGGVIAELVGEDGRN